MFSQLTYCIILHQIKYEQPSRSLFSLNNHFKKLSLFDFLLKHWWAIHFCTGPHEKTELRHRTAPTKCVCVCVYIYSPISPSHFKSNLSKHVLTSVSQSLLEIVPDIDCTVASSIHVSVCSSTMLHACSWATCLISHPKPENKNLKSAALFFSWSSGCPAMSPTCLVEYVERLARS